MSGVQVRGYGEFFFSKQMLLFFIQKLFYFLVFLDVVCQMVIVEFIVEQIFVVGIKYVFVDWLGIWGGMVGY